MAFCNHPRPLQPRFPKPKPVIVRAKPPLIARLFERTYKCAMRAIDIRDIDDVRTYGVMRTGDKETDAALDNEIVTIGLTVGKMATNYNEGLAFQIVDPNVLKGIFEDITEHTDNWRQLLQTGYNIGTAPVEDLIILEEFASAVYSLAKFEYLKENTVGLQKGSLAEYLYKGSGMQEVYISKSNIERGVRANPQFAVREMTYEPQIEIFKQIMVKQHLAKSVRRD